MAKSKKIRPRIPEGEAILDTPEFTMEEYSEACKKLQGEYQRLVNFLVDKLVVKDNSTVLEIGPGPGWISILLAKKNKTLKIVGLEISEDMIRVANKNLKAEGVQDQITFIHGDAKDMKGFSDNSFDVVISNGSLHHWENPVSVFDEIARVVKPDGVFCISDGRRDLTMFATLIFHVFKFFVPKFMRIGWKTSIMAGYIPEELETILEQTDLKHNYEIKTDLFDLIVHNKQLLTY